MNHESVGGDAKRSRGWAEPNDGLIPFPPVETHLLRSKHVRQTFQIQVMRPPKMPGQKDRLPVVYATDANLCFDMFKDISINLQLHAEDAPPYILVGIGHPGNFMAGRLLRCRELTFPPYPELDPTVIPPAFEGELLPEEGAKSFYGAEDFRAFIKDELIPFIDAKYETVPGDRTYFGHSGGGFFGLFTLFTDPSLFRSYICSSPGLLFHGPAPGEGFHYDNHDCGGPLVRDFVASGRSLDGIKLYLSAGAEEEFEASLGSWKVVTGLYETAKVLRKAAIPGLEVITEIFPGETHATAHVIAFMHGVQVMFGTRRVVRSVY